MRDGVLLVLSSIVNRDRCPRLLCFLAWVSGCCSTLTRSSMCQGTRFGSSMEACGRISHSFFVLLALFAWNLDVISSTLCLWQPRAPVVATVHGDFWMNFFYFPREKWIPITLQFIPKIFGIISTSSIWQSPRASVSVVFWKNFTYFHRVGCPGLSAQFALENLDYISSRSQIGGGRVFRRLLRIFRAPPGYLGFERQFSEPSMVKSSLPSLAPTQFQSQHLQQPQQQAQPQQQHTTHNTHPTTIIIQFGEAPF